MHTSNIESMEILLKQTQERLNALEIAYNKPTLEAPNRGDSSFKNFLRYGETKALSSSTDENGGYLVPKNTVDDIYRVVHSLSGLRTYARVTTISGDALHIVIDKGEASAGWVEKDTPLKETDTPKLEFQTIPVFDIYAKANVTQKLIDDAQINVEQWLIEKIAHKIAMEENKAFLFGDGVKQPKGIMMYNFAKEKEHENIETICTDVLKCEDIYNTVSLIESKYLHNAKWFIARSVIKHIRSIKDKNDRHLWQPKLSEANPETILGIPVVILDDLPQDTKEKPNILLADMYECYQIVDRQGINILRDPYSAKPSVEFYVDKRVGGAMLNIEAIKALHIKAD